MSGNHDVEDGVFLALEEAKRLRLKDPDHELLRYIEHAKDQAVWEEFLTRFGPPDLSREERQSYAAMASVYTTYIVALRDANLATPEQLSLLPECAEHTA